MSSLPRWFTLPKQPHPANHHSNSLSPVVIIGAGLAGCHCAYEVAKRNIRVILIDAGNAIADGASGNDAGIVKPFVTRSPSHIDHFYASAFDYMLEQMDAHQSLKDAAQFNQCGVVQLVDKPFPSHGLYDSCTANEASALAGVPIKSDALHFARAGWLNPATLCKTLVEHQNIDVRLNLNVQDIKPTESGWSVELGHKHELTDANTGVNQIECTALILANGERLNRFSQTTDLPITAARGQTSRFTLGGNRAMRKVISDKHYVIPDEHSIVVGASFVRDDQSTSISNAEHQQNLEAVQSLLPTLQITKRAINGFCATRATTPDRMPIVGPVPDFASYRSDYALIKHGLPEDSFPLPTYQQGLYVIGGFGSRGIVSAPYCAKLLIDFLYPDKAWDKPQHGAMYSDLASWLNLLHPARFVIRELKQMGI